MRLLSFVLLVLFCTAAKADENKLDLTYYGSFVHSSQVPNALFFFSDIEKNDSFELRRALRNEDIDTIVLASSGGSVWEALSMAGVIFDRKMATYVPSLPSSKGCYSACSFMFFAGNDRLVKGELGVHQVGAYDKDIDKQKIERGAAEQVTQFTTSEIIGFLNEFQTPPWVFERMFRSREMYTFSESEKIELNVGLLSTELEAEINNFLSRLLLEFQQDKKKRTEEPTKTDVQPKSDNEAENRKYLIEQIQQGLAKAGCDPGPVDGVWGRRTQTAAMEFATQMQLDTSSNLQTGLFLQKLRVAETNSCPKRVSRVAKKRGSNAERWFGHEYCTVIDGRMSSSITVQHVDEKTFLINFPNIGLSGKNETIRFRALNGSKSGEYSFKIGSIKYNIVIDFDRGVLTGRTTETNLAMRAVFAAVLISGYCDIEFQKAS